MVVDPLFGEPFAAAVNAASFGARIVQLGAGAGDESTVSSAPIRGKMLVIMGHTNFAAPPEVKREAYASLSALAASGELKVETEPIELERVAQAWERLAAGSHRKIVLVAPAQIAGCDSGLRFARRAAAGGATCAWPGAR